MTNTNCTCTNDNCCWNVIGTDISNCADGNEFAMFLCGVQGFDTNRQNDVVTSLTEWCCDNWTQIEGFVNTGCCINGTWNGVFSVAPIGQSIAA